MWTKVIKAGTICVALATFFAGNALAACASNPLKGQFKASDLFAMQKSVSAFQSQFQEGPAGAVETKASENDDDRNASIVGLWAITYYVGNSSSVWDQGFEQWHSDGLELNNDNAVPPSIGNVCVGVYKQTGPRTFKLRHMTWNFDATGTLTGVFQLLQTVTVAPNGKIFTGTYISDSFDLSGNVIPALHAEGVLSAARITVD